MKINKYIYVCDADNNRADKWNRLFTIRPIIVVSVKDMVDKICEHVDKNPIKNLYIAGHGGPGYQSVGAGQNNDPSGDRSIQLDESGYIKGSDTHFQLLRLRWRMAPNAIVTLGGCQTGAGDMGKALLLALSGLWGVPVEAGTANQRWVLPGMEGDVNRCDYNSGECTLLPSTWWGSPSGGGIN